MNSDNFDLLFAKAKQETVAILSEDSSRSIADPTLPIYRFAAMQRLEHERLRFEAGEKMALLAGIRVCANHDLAMPEWVAQAFIAGYDEVLSCRSNSWDAVFGKPYPKGKHLAAMRKKRNLSLGVVNAVDEARERGAPVDETLFAAVGREHNIGKTLAAEYYYDWIARYRP